MIFSFIKYFTYFVATIICIFFIMIYMTKEDDFEKTIIFILIIFITALPLFINSYILLN